MLKSKSMLAVAFTVCTQTAYAANPEWDQATSLFTAKNYAGALSALRKLAEKSPRDASIHYMIGRCYKEQGKSQQAKSEFEWVSKYAPDAQTRALAASMLNQNAAAPGVASSPVSANTPPQGFINDSPAETVNAAAKNGWRPCTGGCLTASKPGWHHAKFEGHPDTDLWMPFTNVEYNQYHIGHIIKDVPGNDKSVDTGACPRCGGSGWIKG